MYVQLQEIEWDPESEKWNINYGIGFEGNLSAEKFEALLTEHIDNTTPSLSI